jgi:hypothetical protein
MSIHRTFVFFIRHRSQAFQTLLCLPSITTEELCSCEEDPDRFEVRYVKGFEDFGDFLEW